MLNEMLNSLDEVIGYTVVCPGCNGTHFFEIVPRTRSDGTPAPLWTLINGSMDKPTFKPSMDSWIGTRENRLDTCHFFLTEGVFHFQPDCTHKYAGQQLPGISK